MAITPAHPGISVTIEVNSEALQEYDDPDLNEQNFVSNTSRKYIASVSEAEFSVRVILSDAARAEIESDLLLIVSLDGQKIISDIHRNPKLCVPLVKKYVSVKEEDKWYQRMLTFCQLVIDNTETETTQPKPDTSELGTITIALHRIRIDESSGKLQNCSYSKLQSKVSEKDLKGKGISHLTELGRKVMGRPQTSFNVDYLDDNRYPYATFKFMYRSMADLKSLYVVPRTREPSPVEEVDIKQLETQDIDSLNTQQLREIVRNQLPRNSRNNRGKSKSTKRKRSKATKHEKSTTVKEERYDDPDGEVEFVEERNCKRRFTKAPEDAIDLAQLDD